MRHMSCCETDVCQVLGQKEPGACKMLETDRNLEEGFACFLVVPWGLGSGLCRRRRTANRGLPFTDPLSCEVTLPF